MFDGEKGNGWYGSLVECAAFLEVLWRHWERDGENKKHGQSIFRLARVAKGENPEDYQIGSFAVMHGPGKGILLKMPDEPQLTAGVDAKMVGIIAGEALKWFRATSIRYVVGFHRFMGAWIESLLSNADMAVVEEGYLIEEMRPEWGNVPLWPKKSDGGIVDPALRDRIRGGKQE